jgi:hypothetical protein
MIISTSGKVPSGLPDRICAGASFDDVQSDLLPALADDLDAKSASFRQLIHDGDTVQLGHNVVHRVKPESHHTWRQQFRCLDSIAAAPPIPAGTGQAFSLDEWLDFPEYLRSTAYETFWEPLGIHHVLVVRLAHSDAESFVFGFHRAAGERRFSDADVARMGSLLPVLGSTLSRLRLAEQLERLRGGHAAAVPQKVWPTSTSPAAAASACTPSKTTCGPSSARPVWTAAPSLPSPPASTARALLAASRFRPWRAAARHTYRGGQRGRHRPHDRAASPTVVTLLADNHYLPPRP